MSAWSPASLNMSEKIGSTEPEFLRIVRDEKEFCKSTYFWGLITHTGTNVTPSTPIADFLEKTIGSQVTVSGASTTIASKFSNTTDYTNNPVLKAVDKFMEYFNTPMKIIKCSDPDEYVYGVKSLCDGLFSHYIEKMGRTSSMYKYNIIVMDLMNKLNNEIPFKGDDRTLETFTKFIQSYISSVFKPAQYASDLSGGVKAAIYASYLPYFVFLYILSFIPSAEKKNRTDLTYIETRKARLACYLFIAHMASILNTALTKYTAISGLDAAKKSEYDAKRTLMLQIMGNVSLNILTNESTEFNTKASSRTEELDKMSKDNVTMNKQILADNERYERYKQNLISAANNEKSIDNQLQSAAGWMSVHVWVFIIVTICILVILIIPKDKVPNNYDTLALYILCGVAMLYTLARGIVGAIQMMT